ncbi:hypothetical protein JTE90_006729 [Oedothorax gibbosus]|uniref:Uncharacterized protein n=1 Tax=Oedothorax gibbosus TaxID=931172 RepID=A0AAV6UA10_9ARAC|nr:hypothetical protein JTE90_006729 [Oedothorax gibbosus]
MMENGSIPHYDEVLSRATPPDQYAPPDSHSSPPEKAPETDNQSNTEKCGAPENSIKRHDLYIATLKGKVASSVVLTQ